MAAVLTGTPVAIAWASGTDPATQDVTVPSDATAVYVFWHYYVSGTGNGLSSITLESVSPDQTFELATAATDLSACGVAAWYNPTTGANQTIDVTWDASPTEGAVCAVAFVKDGNTSAWTDADASQIDFQDPNSVTITTVSGDLVLKHDSKFDVSEVAPPSLSSGWTDGVTTANNTQSSRLSSISAGSTTEVCDSEDPDFSTVVGISIPASSGGGIIPRIMHHRQQMS